MDYTTLTRLKLEKSIKEVTDDTLLALLITTASRVVDRLCTGDAGPESDNYFATETKTNETLTAWLDSDGNIVTYLHKPQVTTVTAFAWKSAWPNAYTDVDTSLLEVYGGPIVTAHLAMPVVYSPSPWFGSSSAFGPGKVWIKATYAGGLGATTADLPSDFVEVATEVAIRVYMANKAGLADAIGTVETGIMTYVKAMPEIVRMMLQPYMRTRPWREA